MKITRHGSTKNQGITTLLDRKPDTVMVDSGVRLQFRNILDPTDSSYITHHDYTVELSPEDLRLLVGELLTPLFEAKMDL